MLNKILYYYKKEKKLLAYFLVSSFIVTALDLYSPIVVQELVDKTIPNKDMGLFFKFSILLLGIYIVRLIVSLYSSSRGQLMGNRIKFLMRNDLIEKILNQSSKFFYERQSGDIISRVTNDLENTSALLYRGLEDFLFSILSIVGAFTLMMKFNVKLTILTMIPLPFAVYFTIYQNRKLKNGYVEVRNNMSKLTSEVHDTLKTIFFIKDNVLESKKVCTFELKNKELLEVETKNIFNISALMSGINFYNQITQLIVIFVGGYFHIKGEISFGIILSFILLTNRFRIYLLRLMGLIDTFQRGATGIKRFLEIMDIQDEDIGKIHIKNRIEKIEFDSVGFSYNGNRILKGLSLKVKRGEKIAFVGESGVGKTTLISLLKRSFIQESGSIKINDNRIEFMKKDSYLNRVGVVDQNEHIMNMSLLENITVVKKDYSEDELKRAIKLSGLEEVVENLSDKLDTHLGEKGIALSSGQKQRVALARLFLKDPDVIILDEATSALDNILESKIITNINEEFKDRIVISVAHRLNTLKNYDRIFVLGKNGIKEQGSFLELLNYRGEFYKMYMGDEKA